MRRALRIAVVVLAVGALPLMASRPASAAPSLALTRQTPWILAGGTVDLDLTILDASLDTMVSVSIHQALTSRSAFDLSLEGDGLGTPLHEIAAPVGFLTEIASSERRFPLEFAPPGEPVDGRVPITQPGVYPTVVELDATPDDEDGEPPSFVTYVVVVGGDGSGPVVGEPLGLSWVWPLDADPVIGADGLPDPTGLAALEPDGRVGRQLVALAAHGVATTLAPGGWTVEQLAASQARPQRSLVPLTDDTNQVLTGGYVPLDLPSLLAHDLAEPARESRRLGIDTIEATLGMRVDTRTAVATPVDPASFEFLADASIDRMVVDEADLAESAADRTPARPFRLRSGDRSVLAAAPDPGLVALLDGAGPPALRAQQLVGALSLIAYESPALERGVVLVNPLRWDPEDEFLDAALSGIAGHPLISPMTLDRFFEEVPTETSDGSELERSLEARHAVPPPVNAEAYDNSARRQRSFHSLVGPTSSAVTVGDSVLDVVLSATWGPNSSDASAQLALANTTIDDFLAGIRIPVDRSITLTARTGTIPIQFLNETGQDVTVRVRLESERLDFPEGDVHDVVLPPRSSTQRFEVETRTSGRFPLYLTVTSPDGALAISSARMDVRSTAVSGVGVFLTVGAAVVLAGWWGNDIRKRRRREKSGITPAGGSDGGE